CAIHQELGAKGLKGCMAYDCFGAGQQVAQVTYQGESWKGTPHGKEMYEVFLQMRKLHEMLWYLTEGIARLSRPELKKELETMVSETSALTQLSQQEILKLDLENHRLKVNLLLRQVCQEVGKQAQARKGRTGKQRALKAGYEFIGANLTGTYLIGANLSGSLLIAANLKGVDLTGATMIGTDLRDANICGANLSESLFLTQGQVNTAQGDQETQLPSRLVRPSTWIK
ncbi:MAG: pentapeptide repeat-containing protein, partial [Niameybacter sp.]